MKRINKYVSLFLAVVLFAAVFTPCSVVFGADTVKIGNAREFLDFAKNCKNDSWSKGKNVELTQDIDFSKTEFVCVPTFGGRFNGNGYSIKNVNITKKGSYKGLFRYIQKDGTVENLTVYATVSPSGSKKVVGGICGENSGIISNCTFIGEVSAETSVGGICGYQKEGGKISNCICQGSVMGKSYTGGICGQNYGILENCQNEAAVNTQNNENGKSPKDFDINIDFKETDKTELVNANTDTGGICGYSKGKIISCINRGNIGYKSLGYNTGGICGRTAGYIAKSENHGEINGRKDIGGIAGQAEPYVLLEYSGDVVGRLRLAIDNIRYIINKSISYDDTKLSKSIDDIGDSVYDMTTGVQDISNEITDYADEVTDITNDAVEKIRSAISDSKKPLEDLYAGMNRLSDGLSELKTSGEYIKAAVESIDNSNSGTRNKSDFKNGNKYLSKALGEISRGLADIDSVIVSADKSAEDLDKAVKELEKALETKKDTEAAFLKVFEALKNAQNSYSGAGSGISTIAAAVKELENNGYSVLPSDVIKNLENIAKGYEQTGKAMSELADAMLTFSESLDLVSLRRGIVLTSRGLDDLSTALSYFSKIVERMGKIPDAKENAEKAADSIGESVGYIKDGIDSMSSAVSELIKKADKLETEGLSPLPKPSERLAGGIDSLNSSISGLRNGIGNFRTELKSAKSDLRNDVYDATAELIGLYDILYDAYDESLNASKESVVQDISGVDSDGDTRGKIENSTNKGTVSGDINAGGICGQMAIEYDFDPEDDTQKEGDKSLKFSYKSKCVLRRCENEGTVISKEDYSGGVCGNMDLGSIISCGNYADVKSQNGNYVGGIAGQSNTIIRNCAVKCTVSGGDYIGGIVGKGEKISDCGAIVKVMEYGEFAGSVAGFAEQGNLSGNYFVTNEIGGVDDISYAGAAEETDIGRFVSLVKSNFDRNVEFKLKFVADGKEIAEVSFNYGEDITDRVPKVPKKNGYYGKWSDYDFTYAEYDAVINAEYYRNADIIASSEKREDKPVILVCGAFDDTSSVFAPQSKDLGGSIDARDVEIENCHSAKYEIRYLPKSEKNVKILVDYGNGKQKVSVKKYGSYLQFEAKSEKFTIYETEKNDIIDYIAVVAILLVLIAFVIVLTKRKQVIQKH